jgi:hypothetical protein
VENFGVQRVPPRRRDHIDPFIAASRAGEKIVRKRADGMPEDIRRCG